jgi:hypothetical protein
MSQVRHVDKGGKLMTNMADPKKEISLAERIKKALSEGKGTLAIESLAAPKSAPGTADAPNPVALVRHQQCLLLDCSSSMEEDVEPGTSKHDALRRLLPQFLGTRRFAFSDACAAVSALPAPNGTTDMAGAFGAIKRAGVRHAVLITDGVPNSEAAALREAKGLRLDIFYVGAAPRPAFLDKLAAATGGTSHSSTLNTRGAGRLTAAVKQILALPPGPKKED